MTDPDGGIKKIIGHPMSGEKKKSKMKDFNLFPMKTSILNMDIFKQSQRESKLKERGP